MEMGEKIKHLRKKLNLTLEDVGKKVGVGKSTVRKWESGDIANMRRDKIAKLAEALETTPAYLMGWEKDITFDGMTSNAKFGDRLRRIRLEREMSQEEFADLLGTTKQVISRYETNQRIPKITIANEYAERLGIDIDSLLGREEKEYITQPYYEFIRSVQAKKISPDDLWLALELIEKIKNKHKEV